MEVSVARALLGGQQAVWAEQHGKHPHYAALWINRAAELLEQGNRDKLTVAATTALLQHKAAHCNWAAKLFLLASEQQPNWLGQLSEIPELADQYKAELESTLSTTDASFHGTDAKTQADLARCGSDTAVVTFAPHLHCAQVSTVRAGKLKRS